MSIEAVVNPQSSVSSTMNVRAPKNKSEEFLGVMSAVSAKEPVQKDGEILGMTMFKEEGSNTFWGMKAMYAEESTAENPIIRISSNFGGENICYDVKINAVDPQNASRLEMFALCSYADNQGIGDHSTFGTYQTLKNYEEMALHNGYFDSGAKAAGSWKQFENDKMDWKSACLKVKDLMYRCHDLGQFHKGISMMTLFSKYPA